MARNFAAGDYIEVPSNAVFDGSVGSIACWFKYTQTAANIIVMCRFNAANSRSGIGFAVNNPSTGNVQCFAYDSANQAVGLTTAGLSLNDGAWHHFGASFALANGSAQALYIDGVQKTTGTASRVWAFASQVIRMARPQDSFWTSFVGDIAEIAWWNATLTADEFKALGSGILPFRVRPAALQLYLPLWN